MICYWLDSFIHVQYLFKVCNSVVGYSQLMRFYTGKTLWPIRIGCINPKDQIPKWSMKTIQSITDEDYYFVCMEIFKGLKGTEKVSIIMVYLSSLLLLNSQLLILSSNCFYFAFFCLRRPSSIVSFFPCVKEPDQCIQLWVCCRSYNYSS